MGSNERMQDNANKVNGVDASKVEAGTVEVVARIMGENGEWIEHVVRVNSGVTAGTFDVSSRNGYLTSFDSLEQAMILARNEATREATEQFLQEVGKKQETRNQ